jgi:hypothetical protein
MQTTTGKGRHIQWLTLHSLFAIDDNKISIREPDRIEIRRIPRYDFPNS